MKTPTKEQVDEAIAAVMDFAEFKQQETSEELEKHTCVIAFALRALRMLLDEPITRMVGAYIMAQDENHRTSDTIIRNGYKAMRDKLLEQAGEEK